MTAFISFLLTYTCHRCQHLITSFMSAVQLLWLHCLIVTACIMTLIALPCCYRTTHCLATQTCLPVYKTLLLRRRALSSFFCILRLNIVALHKSPCLSATGVLLGLASESLHWWSCLVGLAFISHCRSTSHLRSSLSLQELNKWTTLWPDGGIRTSLLELLIEQEWFPLEHYLKYKAPTGEFQMENHIRQRQGCQPLNASSKLILKKWIKYLQNIAKMLKCVKGQTPHGMDSTQLPFPNIQLPLPMPMESGLKSEREQLKV